VSDIIIKPPPRVPPVIVEADSPDEITVVAGRGRQGTPGLGVPPGGTDGQALLKDGATDYVTRWGTVSGGGGVS
jgi:hypothetical protein